MKKLICSLVITLFVIGALSTTSIGQRQRDREAEYLEIAQKMTKLSPVFEAKGRVFEQGYPKTVAAIRADALPWEVMHEIWRGVEKKDSWMLALLSQFEAGKLKTQDVTSSVNARISSNTLNAIQCETECSADANHVWAGCYLGTGDRFYCFLLTEQFVCVCENSRCRYGLDCGIIG